MKKRTHCLMALFLCVLLFAADASARIVGHTNWRWRNDDGTEETATWATKEARQPATLVGNDEIIRLRFNNINGFDCGELKVKGAGSDFYTPYSDFFCYGDSRFLTDGEPVQRRLGEDTWGGNVYHPGGVAVESPCLIMAPPSDTFQEIELCLKAKKGPGVSEGTYTFQLPDGDETSVGLIYKHPRAAVVSTLSPWEIAATSATGRGDLKELGLRHPVSYGVCWSDTQDPDTTCSRTDGGKTGSTGLFGHAMTGLSPGTTYYVRAFAVNTGGTAYGEQVRFTTLSAPDTEEPRVTGCNIGENTDSVFLNITPMVTFSEPMDPESLTPASMSLTTAGGVKPSFRHVYVEASRTLVVIPESDLPADTLLTLTISTSVRDRAGNSLYETFVRHFTTANPGADEDSDGVPDSLEQFPGDSSRATVATVTNTGHFTLDASVLERGAKLADVRTLSEFDPSLGTTGKPRDAEFPDGVLAYRVVSVPSGESVELPVGMPSSLPEGTRVYKVTEAGYVEITERCRMEGNTLYVTLTDGGAGDADGEVNGTIDDPLAVAVPKASPSPDTDPVGGTDQGGPCFVRSAGWR